MQEAETVLVQDSQRHGDIPAWMGLWFNATDHRTWPKSQHFSAPKSWPKLEVTLVIQGWQLESGSKARNNKETASETSYPDLFLRFLEVTIQRPQEAS